MSRFIEDMILSCNSMEELEKMRIVVQKMREREDLIKNCKHPIAYHIDTTYGYEYYDNNICLKCGQEIEGGHKVIFPKEYISKNTKYKVAEIYEKMFNTLKENGLEENEIVNEILDFQKFIDEQGVFKDIDDKESKELEELIKNTYDTYKQIKKLIKKL